MIFLIFTLLVALVVALFAVQNADPVTINLLWYAPDVPLVLVILGSAFAGALIVFFMAIWREFRLKGKVKAKAKAEAKEHKEALENAELKSTEIKSTEPKSAKPLEDTSLESNPTDLENPASPDIK